VSLILSAPRSTNDDKFQLPAASLLGWLFQLPFAYHLLDVIQFQLPITCLP